MKLESFRKKSYIHIANLYIYTYYTQGKKSKKKIFIIIFLVLCLFIHSMSVYLGVFAYFKDLTLNFIANPLFLKDFFFFTVWFWPLDTISTEAFWKI